MVDMKHISSNNIKVSVHMGGACLMQILRNAIKAKFLYPERCGCTYLKRNFI